MFGLSLNTPPVEGQARQKAAPQGWHWAGAWPLVRGPPTAALAAAAAPRASLCLAATRPPSYCDDDDE
eukprot:9486998-Pyramimonas_sp.AAC.1